MTRAIIVAARVQMELVDINQFVYFVKCAAEASGVAQNRPMRV
jgi:hypothetical protein